MQTDKVVHYLASSMKPISNVHIHSHYITTSESRLFRQIRKKSSKSKHKIETHNIKSNVSCQFGTYFPLGDNNKNISICSAYKKCAVRLFKIPPC